MGWLSAYQKLDLASIKTKALASKEKDAAAEGATPAAAAAMAAEDLPENWF